MNLLNTTGTERTRIEPLRSGGAVAWVAVVCLLGMASRSDDPGGIERLIREVQDLRQRVSALEAANLRLGQQIEVERLIVRKELIVSDTGRAWEEGFEKHQIPRGIYAKSLGEGPGGLWVRSRLIKTEIDDPFDDRFHAIEKDGSIRRAPGHISWNVWIDGAWRQMAIIQGEGLEPSEAPLHTLTGGNHPGRLRFQTYRPEHGEPLTDALIGQGKMALGGGGYGGGGLPYPGEVLELFGGALRHSTLETPTAPAVVKDDGSGEHQYAIIAVGPQGRRSGLSRPTRAGGLARLRWDSVPGADSYVVVRDGAEVGAYVRVEGSTKEWDDVGSK